MSGKTDNDQYSEEEATRRMNEALRRALTTPPKPQAKMKLGNVKAKPSEPISQSSKKLGRKLPNP